MEDRKSLSDIENQNEAIVVKVVGHGAFRKRIMEMGFVKGQRVKVLLNAPLKDPVKYEVMGYEVSLRRSEAAMIRVVPASEDVDLAPAESVEDNLTTHNDEWETHPTPSADKIINVALVGNPNCGKTSLFNIASGAHEHVGNYSGVTVDAKKGHFDYKGYHINIFDLPGTYSLAAYSPEELYVRSHLTNNTPDVIVNVVVASNLERNLYLTTELIDMNLSMVIALNMYDEMERQGAMLDHEQLGGMIGVPIVPTVSRTNKGIEQLFDTVIAVHEGKDEHVRHIHINHGTTIEKGINRIKTSIKESGTDLKQYAPRYLAIKLLEGDSEVVKLLQSDPNYPQWQAISQKEAARIETEMGEDVESAIANQKYGFIAGALKETYTPGRANIGIRSNYADRILTNKWLGFPIFILLMWAMFEATFTLGEYPMGWIESAVAYIGTLVEQYMPTGALKDLLIDGVIGGVGGVIVFLPNILILFLIISFMEDSGYMARAAFIMDKLMHGIGLHGKSFIPLIMGFGCSVPAIMATRTIESRSSRLITMLITPFMSCSARLPVYILLAGIFLPEHAGLTILAIYLLGIVVAIITAILLRRVYFKKDETPFVMELPPYRIPTLKTSLRHMWGKGSQYLRKMGGIILVASIAIWFLSYYPRPVEGITTTTEEQQRNSYIGRLGTFIEPAVAPLGFNWKVSISLLSGIAAKEIVVSTIGVLYQEDVDDEGGSSKLSHKLSHRNPETNEPDFTPAIAISFMAFVLLYFPCLASVVAIVKESGSWIWGVLSIGYSTGVAWIVAYGVYNLAQLFLQ